MRTTFGQSTTFKRFLQIIRVAIDLFDLLQSASTYTYYLLQRESIVQYLLQTEPIPSVAE